MRLSTKLFVFIGALLLIICLAIYAVPVLIVRKHVAEDRAWFSRKVEQELIEDQRHFESWLRQDVGEGKGAIDAALYLVSGHAELRQAFFRSKEFSSHVWFRAARLLSHTEVPDFLQITDERDDNYAITLSNAHLYVARPKPINETMAWVVAHQVDNPSKVRGYLAVWMANPDPGVIEVPDRPMVTAPETFLLFDPIVMLNNPTRYQQKLAAFVAQGEKTSIREIAQASKLTLQTLQSLVRAEKYVSETFRDEEQINTYLDDLKATHAGQYKAVKFPPTLLKYYAEVTGYRAPGDLLEPSLTSAIESEQHAFILRFIQQVRRSNDLDMISAIGFLVAGGAVCTSPFENSAPVGAARIIVGTEEGTAVLSGEVFSERNIFPAAQFLSENPPLREDVPIASAFGLIGKKYAGAVTLANTARIFTLPNGELSEQLEGYFTLGSSLKDYLSTFSHVTGDPSFMVIGNQIVEVADVRGEADLRQLRLGLQQHLPLGEQHGTITIGEVDYVFAVYQPDPDDVTVNLNFVTLKAADKVFASIDRFEMRSKQLTMTLTRNIIAVTLGVFIVGLLILELISRHFTKPIRQLAKATEKVAAGEYEGIELPP